MHSTKKKHHQTKQGRQHQTRVNSARKTLQPIKATKTHTLTSTTDPSYQKFYHTKPSVTKKAVHAKTTTIIHRPNAPKTKTTTRREQHESILVLINLIICINFIIFQKKKENQDSSLNFILELFMGPLF